MSNVFDINENLPHYNVLAMCVSTLEERGDTKTCFHRWIATIPVDTCLTKLECPKCGSQNSFASSLEIYIDPTLRDEELLRFMETIRNQICLSYDDCSFGGAKKRIILEKIEDVINAINIKPLSQLMKESSDELKRMKDKNKKNSNE